MAHFTTCLIFEVDPQEKDGYRNIIKNQKDKYLDLLTEDLAADLELFDLNKEVEPHKTYLLKDEVAKIAEYNKISATDFPAIVEKIYNWNGNQGGVDEKGLYEISTNNPNGHYDNWSLFDVDLAEDVFKKIDMIDRIPRALILPDLSWTDGPYIFGGNKENSDLQKWEEKLKKTFEMYKDDGVVVFIDCHQ